jgi:type IV pilus assembly protein PilB
MTLSQSRPVPDASSREQQRFEVELLLQQPVLGPSDLDKADRELIETEGPRSPQQWMQWGAMPLHDLNGVLRLAVPTHWGAEQREDLLQALQLREDQASFGLALADDLTEALAGLENLGEASATTEELPRSWIEDLTLPIGGLEEETTQNPDDLEVSSIAANASPVVSLVDRILIEGLRAGASDIHVEPQETGLEIRFRLDGVLQKQLEALPKNMVPAITSRFKIMADLDIAERRLPQDGRIRRKYRGRTMDFRVSTLPSRHGEKVCLRLLDSGATQLGLDTLITDNGARAALRALGSKPFGMILVTGPTGSGKSTTLYALLSERNEPGINISTVEDPIEYTLQGITQTQVNRDKGFDFSTALRAFMRQDPDVLLVGETRDIETAKTATEAALTGHLVLTTLHCNDAASAIARLDEMGVEPFMVSASLIGIVSQRLLRRVCSHCRIAYQPSSEELGRFGLLASHETAVTFYRAHPPDHGPGACSHCQGNGYKGRVGVYEILNMTETIAAAVAKRASTDVLRRLALESGMKTLLGYGLELVREGLTTLEEVERMLLTDAGLESERRARSLSALTCRSCGAGLRDEWLECPYCLKVRN